MYRENSKDQSLLKISPVITEISQQGSLYFLIARAYQFFPKNAEQFVPGPNDRMYTCRGGEENKAYRKLIVYMYMYVHVHVSTHVQCVYENTEGECNGEK